MKKIALSITALCIFFTTVKAQTDSIVNTLKVTNADVSKAVTDLKTGQANDIITKFYQLGIKNIFGDKKEVAYSSTIFGLLKNLREKYEEDTQYSRYRWARNIELSANGKIDTASKLTGFGGGVKLYLLNKRDISKKNNEFNATLNSYAQEINGDMVNAKRKFLNDPAGPGLLDSYAASFQKFYKSFDYHDLPPRFIDTLRKMDSKIVTTGLVGVAKKYFDAKVAEIKQKPLWSLGGNYYHAVNAQSDTSTLSSEFLVGFKTGKQGSLEFNASGYMKFFNSPEQPSAQAKKLHFETGLNGILSKASDGTSNMELKFFGSYDRGYNTASIPLSTKANLTYRYLVSQLGGFWIPVTFSWDPGTGKIFGLVDLTFNIDPVKK